MKRFVFLFLVIMSLSAVRAAYVYAQAAPEDAGVSAIDLTTFTGIVGAVSLAVTQLAKLVPAVQAQTWLKILVSVGVAILASLLAWHFGLAQFLQGLAWWMAVCYGVGAGLTASGAYALRKSLFTVNRD
jgi:hypothetical protein